MTYEQDDMSSMTLSIKSKYSTLTKDMHHKLHEQEGGMKHYKLEKEQLDELIKHKRLSLNWK